MGIRALPSGPWGPQQPKIQIILPGCSTENASRTVKMRFFAILAYVGPEKHKSFATKTLLQGGPTPEISQNRSVFANLTLFGTATKPKPNEGFPSFLTDPPPPLTQPHPAPRSSDPKWDQRGGWEPKRVGEGPKQARLQISTPCCTVLVHANQTAKIVR